ncbi:MAG: alpha/beta hydrolase [Chloroflexales bacterium]|nr:alpha/beta hydrolase [Chloroflexales bacterium]
METIVNGVRLFYEDRGQGPAVLFVHGFPLNSAMWQPQIEYLSSVQSAYRVIVPDLRGFGASDVPEGPYLMETFADDLASLLDTLGLDQVVLGGLSMGGYIAFAFMRRYAERVRALILCDTRPTVDSHEAQASRETNAQLAEREGVGLLLDKMLPALLAPQVSGEVQSQVRTIALRNDPKGIAGALRGMAQRADATDLLPQIRVPTLIIVGAQDSLTPPDVAHAMQSSIPNSRVVEIPSAGHVPPLENPAAFNKALAAFLGEI